MILFSSCFDYNYQHSTVTENTPTNPKLAVHFVDSQRALNKILYASFILLANCMVLYNFQLKHTIHKSLTEKSYIAPIYYILSHGHHVSVKTVGKARHICTVYSESRVRSLIELLLSHHLFYKRECKIDVCNKYLYSPTV